MKKALLVGSLIVVGLAGLVALLLAMPNKSDDATTAPKAPRAENSTQAEAQEPAVGLATGRYTDYDAALVEAEGFDTTILFFHASWCPECRAFEQAILDSDLRDGLQILKVDYDTSGNLRKQYGVTLQSTFVSVDTAGLKRSLWVGYGKDKSVAAIESNL